MDITISLLLFIEVKLIAQFKRYSIFLQLVNISFSGSKTHINLIFSLLQDMVTVSVDGSVLDRIAKIMSYLRLGSSGKVLKKKKKEKDTKGMQFYRVNCI